MKYTILKMRQSSKLFISKSHFGTEKAD